MKRFILLALLLAVLFSCSACKNDVENKFLDVINNEQSFVLENNQDIYIKDYEFAEGQFAVPTEYAFVDFDNDNKNEMIINLSKNSVAYLVLYQGESEIYGFLFYRREMQQIKSDGTFSATGGAGYTSYHKLKFKDNKYEITDLAIVNDYENKYFLNGVDCSQNEVQDFVESFNNSSNVEWNKIEN